MYQTDRENRFTALFASALTLLVLGAAAAAAIR